MTAIALGVTGCGTPGQPALTTQSNIPRRGQIYVDIKTDSTGAVANIVFLNKVAPEIQERIRSQTLGRHFGLPNYSYRRHVQYELTDPPKRSS
jgi:hypothetical protein